MEIIKKNLLSIICGAVALVAVAASFYPLGNYKASMQTTLAQRATVYSSLESLRTKGRNKPVLDTDNNNAEPLGRYPNQEIIDQATQKKKEFEAQADKILKEAVTMNKHDVLVQNVFPAPASSAYLFNFREVYRDAIEQRIAAILKSCTLPTQKDVETATAKLKAEKFTAPGGANQTALDSAFTLASANLGAEIQLQFAKEHLCYMDPLTALPVNAKVKDAVSAPAIGDVWYAQLGYWIYEDVAKAIAATNAGATNIMDAPVKHVLKIQLGSTLNPLPYILPPGSTGAIEGDANAAVPKATEVSPTGRVCNPLYDVVAFQVQVNIEAAKLPWLLKELENKHFISVHCVNITSVDSIAQQLLGYYYGEKPIAQVTLDCEEIMFRDWSHKLMPPSVASDMRGDSGAGTTPGGGGPAMPGGGGPIIPGGGGGGGRGRDAMF